MRLSHTDLLSEKQIGEGTIDGNGLKYHQQFWLRRTWNKKCTNKDEQRPRLVYIQNSKNVQIEGICMQNSPFWTNHVYNSENVKFLNLRIYSLDAPRHASALRIHHRKASA